MHRTIAKVILVAWLCSLVSFGQNFDFISSLTREFAKGAELSDSEIKDVLKLAAKAGLTDVAEIRTHYRHDVGITVKGPEKREGRNVSFVRLEINTVGLMQEMMINPTKGVWVEGKFWVGYGTLRTNRLTVFETKGRTLRVEVGKDVSLDGADLIVDRLGGGKVRYGDARTTELAGTVDVSKLVSVYKRMNGETGVWFSCGEACDVSFDCVLEKDGIVLKNPLTVVD